MTLENIMNSKLHFCADKYYISAQLEYYKFAQEVLHFCAGITFLRRKYYISAQVLHFCASITFLRTTDTANLWQTRIIATIRGNTWK